MKIEKGKTYHVIGGYKGETFTVQEFESLDWGVEDCRTGTKGVIGIRRYADGYSDESWARVSELGSQIQTTKGTRK
jgi:hypothetical protein